jgi:hypothetical protein
MPLEKVFETYLLRSKKRYAGWKCDEFGGEFKLMVKGFENVRRSTCREVRVILDQILIYLVKEANVDKAFAYAKQAVISLLEAKVDIHGLVMTASLSKNSYVTPPAVFNLKERMRAEKRDKSTIPVVGNRVSYLYTAGNTHGSEKMKSKLSDMIEIPEYVFEHDIPINYMAYLEKQYRNPLNGMFEWVEDGRMDQLIQQACLEAVRPVHVSSASTKIGSFLSYTPRCINCNAGIPDAKAIPFGRPPAERLQRYEALRLKRKRAIEEEFVQYKRAMVSVEVEPNHTADVDAHDREPIRVKREDEDVQLTRTRPRSDDPGDDEHVHQRVKRENGDAIGIRSESDVVVLHIKSQDEEELAHRIASEMAIMHSEYKDGALDRDLFPEHYPAVAALCPACEPTRMHHMVATVEEVARLEKIQHGCWSQCQRCVKSRFGPDRCNNNDCRIYYRRKTTSRELTQQRYRAERIAV